MSAKGCQYAELTARDPRRGTRGCQERAPVRALCYMVGMAQPDPWLEQYGKRRRSRRESRGLGLAVALAALIAIVAAVLVIAMRRDDGWRPPSGLRGFHGCTYGDRVAARCASVRVPEDPRHPAGRQIALHVAVIPATRQPARGALFYLEGGPGGAASAAAVSLNEVFAKVSEFRDVVLVDQRGTGGSDALACPQEHVRATDAEAVASYLHRCFAKLGVHARWLTSEAAAADLERVRRALGYGRIDVFGGSYGATLAQLYLRDHPRSVRTLTLDGASLPSVPVYELAPRNAERALRLQIARCRAEPACRRAYPDTRSELGRVLARRSPGAADDLATAIAVLLRAPEDAARVPLVIHAAAAGDLGPLRSAYAEHVGRELDERARLAMTWVTLCGEPWARFDPGATARASAGSFLAHAAIARARLFRRACAVVPHGAGGQATSGPWSSRVPVLMLAGGADPQDPPANLRGWRMRFPDGRLIAVPALAHGTVAYGCLRLVVARFVATGSARGLSTGCVRRSPLPRFELS
jgi:pimeloyl-ACP methyl ester carboxylesterase